MTHLTPPSLSAPPAFARFAWHGISLLLPDTWNLTLHLGTPKKGALLFTDLRAPQLEIRWKTPRLHSPTRTLQKTIARLKSPAKQLAPNTHRLKLNAATLILTTDAHRLYELHFPTASSSVDPLLADFLAATPPLADAPFWPWSVYGIQASLPAHATLKTASLLPGKSQLSFSHAQGTSILGSYSLADRLLQHHSLRSWATATLPFLQSHPTGTWQESPTAAHYSLICKHLLPFPRTRSHQLSFHHNPAANQIHWTHHAETTKKQV